MKRRKSVDPRTEPLGTTVPAKLKTAIQVMEANLEEPIPVPQICKRAGISHRQLDRLFATYIKKTPALYYRDIRLVGNGRDSGAFHE